MINNITSYFNPDGTPTVDGIRYFRGLESDISASTVYNVRTYGAKGDGSTDDTAAIEAAITAAGTNGSVYFPEGVYIFSDTDADGVGLWQSSGQRWFGDGPEQSILRLAASTTDIDACIGTDAFAEDYSIENLQLDGNRANITPAVDLFNHFYGIVGARGGKRARYRNLRLANIWGRALQTSNEGVSEYAEDILVETVYVENSGTKAISVTQSKRVTVAHCYAEVDPYAAADHGGSGDANSGSCFEVNDGHDVIIYGCHGVQVGASIAAPGLRLTNGSTSIRAFGNTIDGGSYLGFIQNVSVVDFHSNIGRDIRGNGIYIGDNDPGQPTDACLGIRVHHNYLFDVDDAYVLIQANKSGYNANVLCYVYENDFVQSAGTPTSGINNAGVAAPATGGSCFVYAWGNTLTGTIPNEYAGAAADEIRGQPKSGGWEILEQSSVASSHTGDTTETNLAVVTIPANSMGPNGRLRVTALWTVPNSANNKTPRIRWSGNQVYTYTATTTNSVRGQVEICNRNSASSQVINSAGAAASGFGNGAAVTTLAINTAANINLQISGQLANSGETITLESYMVEIYYGA